MPTSGENFRKVRERLGLTQGELAKKLKLSQSTISLYELDVMNPSYKAIAKLIALAKKNEIKAKWEDFEKRGDGK